MATVSKGRSMNRPVMRYHGGKFRLGSWIISHFPKHRIYVEPFCGAASVFMQKPRCYSEIVNDLDGDIVGLFRVLQSELASEELERLLRVTPYSRAEFKLAYEPCEEPIERARRTLIRAYMGFGSASVTYDTAAGTGFRAPATEYMRTPTGFRSNSRRSGTVGAQDWANYPECLFRFTERLRGVAIENREAAEVIAQHDSPHTLFYVDPPYPHSTRASRVATGSRKEYRFEMSDEDHRALAEVLRGCAGMVVLSGYSCALYDEMYGDWARDERASLADGARKRVEVLWLNAAAAKGMAQGSLWGGVDER